jgi:hypothetical protein
VPNVGGRLNVLAERGRRQSDMGEALTLDSIVGSVDAEVVAVGPSDKGPNRGAILRHGSRTLWSFAGGVDAMTEAGRALFVNTVAYAAKFRDAPVLEKRTNKTRDALLDSLAFARRVPGYIATIKRLYVPKELAEKNLAEIEAWVKRNRPYLRSDGRRLTVDPLARELKTPNHRTKYLELLIRMLSGKRKEEALAALHRYAGRKDLGADADAWARWFRENRRYLWFSDCDGFRFKLDEEAKRKKVAAAKLRGWSSENVDYRLDSVTAEKK